MTCPAHDDEQINIRIRAWAAISVRPEQDDLVGMELPRYLDTKGSDPALVNHTFQRNGPQFLWQRQYRSNEAGVLTDKASAKSRGTARCM